MTTRISPIMRTLIADLERFDFEQTAEGAGIEVAMRCVATLKQRCFEAAVEQQRMLTDMTTFDSSATSFPSAS